MEGELFTEIANKVEEYEGMDDGRELMVRVDFSNLTVGVELQTGR